MNFRTYFLLLGAVAYVRGETPAPSHASPGDPVVLENLLVTAAPFERAQTNVTSSTTVLAGQTLRLRQQATLGETLAGEPGIASTYFGPGASRPVIRGLGQDRVRVLSNGLGTFDASITSPDHAVALEPLLAERIEVVRGPAALLYGSNAVGGVVNVIDDRIPTQLPEAALTGRVGLRAASAAEEQSGAAEFAGRADHVAWHIEGMQRKSDDVRIKGFADPANPENGGRLTNSAVETRSYGAGLSLIREHTSFGVAANRYKTEYGVVAEPDVRIELEQDRFELHGHTQNAFGFFSGARVRAATSDYRHIEWEGTEAGTEFENEGAEARVELLHADLLRLAGAWGLQAARNDLSVIGDEAFLPPSTTKNLGLFAYEELVAGSLTWQGGARVDQQKIATAAENVREDTASGSLGALWQFSTGYGLSASLAYTERAPNAQELFSYGPHVGTNAFEVGNPSLEIERSTGLDVSVRKTTGRLTGVLTVFANRFDRFIFEERIGEQDEDSDLEIYEYVQRDAEFVGAEAEILVHLHESKAHTLDVRVTADTVRAKERATGDYLPRIPTQRTGAALIYRSRAITAQLGFQNVGRARHLAPGETATASYTLVDASAAYTLEFAATSWELFVRGANLTDRAARNHVSFLKDIAPLPGRDVAIGLRASF